MNRKKLYIRIVLLLIFPLVVSSCLKDVTDHSDRIAARTILYYMAGDNNLGQETQDKVDALVAAWNSMGVNQHLLIYQDRGGEYAPRLLEIETGENGKGKLVVLAEYETENSASQRPFARAINEMVNRYPGTDYGLIVFSNSSGWLPAENRVRPFSTMTDGNHAFELTDFANIIPDGQFKFIVFTSGLMAGVEVAYELKDKTEYILASSADVFSPGFTPVYAGMIQKLYRESPDLKGVAKDYVDHCNSLSGNSRSATVSVIRPRELAPLKKLLAQIESNVENWEWIDRTNIQHFDLRQFDVYMFYDLEGYIRTIGKQNEVDEFMSILGKAVSYKAATNEIMSEDSNYGFQIKQHCGLTIYIPISGATNLNQKRQNLRLFDKF